MKTNLNVIKFYYHIHMHILLLYIYFRVGVISKYLFSLLVSGSSYLSMRGMISLLAWFLLLHISLSDGAYLSELGNITPCLAPCIDYGIVIQPRDKANTLHMSIYEFSRRKDTPITPLDVKKIMTSDAPIDFDKVFSNNVTMASYMMPLVKEARDAVSRDHHLSTPIFFSINERVKSLNPQAWFKVLGDVVLFFGNKTVPFLTGPYSVIENDDYKEASYRWHLINFLQGAFQGQAKKTVGVLSFSGNMVSEISYEKRTIDKSVTTMSTIQGVPHIIVTSTFFKRGESFPLRKYFEVISSPRKSTVESPCGPPGLKKRLDGLSGVKWIVGTGDITKCRDLIRQNLLSICDEINGCAYLKHPFKGKIHAFPDVAMTMEKLGYKECIHDFTPAKLDAATRRVCGVSSVPAKKGDAPAKREKRGKATKRGKSGSHGIVDCVNGNFLYLMLTEGYHLKDSTMIYVENHEIAGLELDPSLGELLQKMELL